jgi:hypothetical protein
VIECIQVTYSQQLARILHRVPLILAAAVPLLSANGCKQKCSISIAYMHLLQSAFISLVSAVCAVLTPVAFSMAFVCLTGEHVVQHCYKQLSPATTPGGQGRSI